MASNIESVVMIIADEPNQHMEINPSVTEHINAAADDDMEEVVSEVSNDESDSLVGVAVETGEDELKFERANTAKDGTPYFQPMYKCDLCDKCFPRPSKVLVHRRTHTGEKPFPCSFCEMRFATKITKQFHEKIHTGENPYKCKYCSMSFRYRSHLLTHLKTHGVVGRTYKCSKCDLVFTDKDEIILHRKTHKEEQRFVCDTCGQRFTRLHQAKIHQRIHTGDRPYKCTVCHSQFTTSSTLNTHFRIHTGEKPYTCEHCGISFTQRTRLKNHRCSHGDNKQDDEKLQCSICDTTVIGYAELKNHFEIHTSPFVCEYCPKRFKRPYDRSVHERVHTGERPFKCQYCDSAFKQRGHLQDHERIHKRIPLQGYSSECGGEISNEAEAEDHADRVYVCASCNQNFQSLDDVCKHVCLNTEPESDFSGTIYLPESTPSGVVAETETVAMGTDEPVYVSEILVTEPVADGPSEIHLYVENTDAVQNITPDVNATTVEIFANEVEAIAGTSPEQAIDTVVASSPFIQTQTADVCETNESEIVQLGDYSEPAESAYEEAKEVAQLDNDAEPDENSIAKDDALENDEVVDNEVTDTHEDRLPETETELEKSTIANPVPHGAGEETAASHECQYCGKVYTTRFNLSRHMKCHPEIEHSKSDLVSEEDEKETGDASIELVEKDSGNDEEYAEVLEIEFVNFPEPVKITVHKCPHCERDFNTSRKLHSHMKIHKGKPKLKLCTVCGIFLDKTKLKTHMKKQHPSIQYKCSQCDKVFKERWIAKAHVDAHNGKKPHKCKADNCKATFTRLTFLNQHIRRVHSDRMYTCDVCGVTFKSEQGLNGHVAKEHSTEVDNSNSTSILCPTCGKSISKQHMKKHEERHRADQPYKCPACAICFSSEENFVKHMKSHQRKKPYKCQHCGQAFAKPEVLKVHMRQHTGEKPFKCRFCPKVFRQRGHRLGHERTHTGEKCHPCLHCDMRFTWLSQLKSHCEKFHSGLTSTSQITRSARSSGAEVANTAVGGNDDYIPVEISSSEIPQAAEIVFVFHSDADGIVEDLNARELEQLQEAVRCVTEPESDAQM